MQKKIKISPFRSTVFKLRIKGKTIPQIAKKLNVTEKRIKSQFARL